MLPSPTALPAAASTKPSELENEFRFSMKNFLSGNIPQIYKYIDYSTYSAEMQALRRKCF
jgi:hypothetical protein